MKEMIHRMTTAKYRVEAGVCESRYARTGDIRYLEAAGHMLLAAVNVYPVDPRVSQLAREDIRDLRVRAVSFLRSFRAAQGGAE